MKNSPFLDDALAAVEVVAQVLPMKLTDEEDEELRPSRCRFVQELLRWLNLPDSLFVSC